MSSEHVPLGSRADAEEHNWFNRSEKTGIQHSNATFRTALITKHQVSKPVGKLYYAGTYRHGTVQRTALL